MNIIHNVKYRQYPVFKAAVKVIEGYITKKRMPLYTALLVTQRCILKRYPAREDI